MRRLVFDQSSPVQPVSESRGGPLSVTAADEGWKLLCLILDDSTPETAGFSDTQHQPPPQSRTRNAKYVRTHPKSMANQEPTNKRFTSNERHSNDSSTSGTDIDSTDCRNEQMNKPKQIFNDSKSIVFNYSSIDITESMDKLLNCGLNFFVLPYKLDLTQTLVDEKKFERAVIWTDFWHGRDKEIDREIPIFKQEKYNLPKKYSVPEGLKTFLAAIKSEILDPRNRNQESSNLPPNEVDALKELIRLQRERKIGIKSCDKGAGILIVDFEGYVKVCYEHLLSKQGDDNPYYILVDDLASDQATNKKMYHILDKGLEKEFISISEYNAMLATDMNHGCFLS